MGDGVVVTGMGIVSSLGHDVPEFWGSLREGRQALVADERVPWVSPVADGWGEDLRGTVRRQTDRSTRMAVVAAEQALREAGLLEHELRREMITVIGSAIGGIETLTREVAVGARRGVEHMSPLILPKSLINMAAANVSIHFGLHGESLTMCSACASGTVAIGEGYVRLSSGTADLALVGGVDAALVDESLESFRRLGALAKTEHRHHASVPFSKHRNGFVMGEGAGMLVLEREEHARTRGAPVLGRIVGYGGSSDAHHRIAPHVQGMRRAVTSALRDVPVEDIGYVNAHGTSTELNDRMEASVLEELLPHRPPVSSTKACHGHTLGAAGAIEAIACLRALRDREVIVNHGVTAADVDEDININLALDEGQEIDGDLALSTSFAFGGHNAAVVLGR